MSLDLLQCEKDVMAWLTSLYVWVSHYSHWSPIWDFCERMIGHDSSHQGGWLWLVDMLVEDTSLCIAAETVCWWIIMKWKLLSTDNHVSIAGMGCISGRRYPQGTQFDNSLMLQVTVPFVVIPMSEQHELCMKQSFVFLAQWKWLSVEWDFHLEVFRNLSLCRWACKVGSNYKSSFTSKTITCLGPPQAVAVNNLGKWKTATQMVALTLLLASRDGGYWFSWTPSSLFVWITYMTHWFLSAYRSSWS